MAGTRYVHCHALMLPERARVLKVGSTGPFAYLTAITAPSIAILPAGLLRVWECDDQRITHGASGFGLHGSLLAAQNMASEDAVQVFYFSQRNI